MSIIVYCVIYIILIFITYFFGIFLVHKISCIRKDISDLILTKY